MTEDLRNRVRGIYNDLKTIIQATSITDMGSPTIQTLRWLATEVKDSGGRSSVCDGLLDSLKRTASGKILAGDAFTIAGQLLNLTERP